MDGFLFGKSLCEMQGSKNLCRLCSKFFFERPQTWTWLTRRQTEEKGVSQLYIKHWKTKNILKHICRIPFCTHFFGYFIEIFYQNMSPKNGRWKKTHSNAQKTPPMKSDEIRTENLVIRWNPDKIREVDFSSNIFLKKWSSSKSLLKNWSSNI